MIDAHQHLKATYGTEWRVLPPYPYGYAQIADHRPYELLPYAVAAAAICVVLRQIFDRAGVRAGRWAATALHGPGWLTRADKAGSIDWVRFGETAWYSFYHVVACGFFAWRLRSEFGDPARWFAFEQPALGDDLKLYLIAQFGANIESAAYMAWNIARSGRVQDRTMLLHHCATLFVMFIAVRSGFARIGVAVLLVHDATDIFIDGLRVSNQLDWPAA